MTSLRRRPGFTVIECVVAIAVLGVAAVLVAQIGVRSLAERVNVEEHFAAQEATANILEVARATAWTDLTPAWASTVRPPNALTTRLDDVKLTVRVEPEKGRPRIKRVTVELRWSPAEGHGDRAVTTMALFADRAAGGGL